MKVFIIGTGNVGAQQARAAAKAGHSVSIFSSTSEEAAKVAAETGASVAASVAEGAKGVDLVYLAVPGSVLGSVAVELQNIDSNIVILDGTNPLNATFSDLDITGVSGAGDLQGLFANNSVVKAFNTVFAGRITSPSQKGSQLQAFIAGDSADAKKVVAEYATSLGFDALDVGGLRFARSLEEMAFLNIALNASNSLSWQSAWSLSGPEKLA